MPFVEDFLSADSSVCWKLRHLVFEISDELIYFGDDVLLDVTWSILRDIKPSQWMPLWLMLGIWAEFLDHNWSQNQCFFLYIWLKGHDNWINQVNLIVEIQKYLCLVSIAWIMQAPILALVAGQSVLFGPL